MVCQAFTLVLKSESKSLSLLTVEYGPDMLHCQSDPVQGAPTLLTVLFVCVV